MWAHHFYRCASMPLRAALQGEHGAQPLHPRHRPWLLVLGVLTACSTPHYSPKGGGGRVPPVRVSDPASQGDIDLESTAAGNGGIFYFTKVSGQPPKYRIYFQEEVNADQVAEHYRKPTHLAPTPSNGIFYSLVGDPVVYFWERAQSPRRVPQKSGDIDIWEVLGIVATETSAVVLGRTEHGLHLFRVAGNELVAVAGTAHAGIDGRLIVGTDAVAAYVAMDGSQETILGFDNAKMILAHPAKSIGEAILVGTRLCFAATEENPSEPWLEVPRLWRSDDANLNGCDMGGSRPHHLTTNGSLLFSACFHKHGITVLFADPAGSAPAVPLRFDAATSASRILGLAVTADNRLWALAQHADDCEMWTTDAASPTDLCSLGHSAGHLVSPRKMLASFVGSTPGVALLAGAGDLWVVLDDRYHHFPCPDSDGGFSSPRLEQVGSDLYWVASYAGRAATYWSRNIK